MPDAAARAHPMWCDDFDMDLPRILPDAAEQLGPLLGLGICTHGSTTDGSLNHPSVWNDHRGMLAFFGRGTPHKPAPYWTDKPVVHCTLWQAVRDAWCHTYLIVFEDAVIFDAHRLRRPFEALMWHTRGWCLLPLAEVRRHQDAVRGELERCRLTVVHKLGVGGA